MLAVVNAMRLCWYKQCSNIQSVEGEADISPHFTLSSDCIHIVKWCTLLTLVLHARLALLDRQYRRSLGGGELVSLAAPWQ